MPRPVVRPIWMDSQIVFITDAGEILGYNLPKAKDWRPSQKVAQLAWKYETKEGLPGLVTNNPLATLLSLTENTLFWSFGDGAGVDVRSSPAFW